MIVLKNPLVFIWKIQMISNHFLKIIVKNRGVLNVSESFGLQPASINHDPLVSLWSKELLL